MNVSVGAERHIILSSHRIMCISSPKSSVGETRFGFLYLGYAWKICSEKESGPAPIESVNMMRRLEADATIAEGNAER